MPISFDEAMTFAQALPGVEIASCYNRPAAKVRGKAFVTRSGEAGSFGVAAALGEIELLIETGPDAFRQSPHYAGHPIVLVRKATAEALRATHA